MSERRRGEHPGAGPPPGRPARPADPETLRAVVEPALAGLGLELFDLEAGGGRVRITVDRDGGVDLDALAEATRVVSVALDVADPIPGRYTLEVSSPGLERPLRRPEHYRRAVGSTVSVRLRDDEPTAARVLGVLTGVDDEGILVGPDPSGALEGSVDEPVRLAWDRIERARTVFTWGPSPKPGGGSPRRPKTKKAATS